MLQDERKGKIDSIEEVKLREGFKSIITQYLNPAYGSMSKRDFDILLFIELQNMGLIPKNPEIYDLVSSLKVTRSKARNLLYESKLRTTNSNALDSELKEILVKPIFLKDGDKISLEIGNPFLIDHMRSKLKELGHITDGSFSSELVKLTTDAFVALFDKMIEDRNKDTIKQELINCGAKEDASFKAVLKSTLGKVAEKIVGQVGEEVAGNVVDSVSGYLNPILGNSVEIMKDRFTELFRDKNEQN